MKIVTWKDLKNYCEKMTEENLERKAVILNVEGELYTAKDMKDNFITTAYKVPDINIEGRV